ncbi:MAG TPA: LptA/OstA family protein [Woeseiaceae bacterium]|jgi:lipopolysaccharide export system protein LptA|nr:LptA/OstA family protein [Woeseiaceae bacterium]
MTSTRNLLHSLLPAALLALPVAGSAQVDDLRLPISLDADSTAYDGNSSMLVFEGLRLSQGSIGVQADEGRASKLDFQDSVWRFEGNVVIDVENGHIECDSADLRFADHQLRFATIKGAPASFEVRRPQSDETTYAEAGLLEYNLETGVIEFSGNAVFTEGGNQIASSFIAYNINERRINAQSSGEGDDKVKITFTPQATEQSSDSEEASPDEEDARP